MAMVLMLDLAPQEVVILLEGDLDSDLLTVGDDSLLALSPLHLSAVSGAAHPAHSAPRALVAEQVFLMLVVCSSFFRIVR